MSLNWANSTGAGVLHDWALTSGSSTGPGSGAGQFERCRGASPQIPSSGNLLRGRHGRTTACEEFSSGEAAFIAAFGSAGSGAAQLSGAQALTVSSTGNVFVADTANNRDRRNG